MAIRRRGQAALPALVRVGTQVAEARAAGQRGTSGPEHASGVALGTGTRRGLRGPSVGHAPVRSPRCCNWSWSAATEAGKAVRSPRPAKLVCGGSQDGSGYERHKGLLGARHIPVFAMRLMVLTVVPEDLMQTFGEWNWQWPGTWRRRGGVGGGRKTRFRRVRTRGLARGARPGPRPRAQDAQRACAAASAPVISVPPPGRGSFCERARGRAVVRVARGAVSGRPLKRKRGRRRREASRRRPAGLRQRPPRSGR
uniref:uncharacterized protein LOC118523206 n=1 Tax=Halichoerus grypus TaxID=9711 RepID=UPI0016599844|nr:uncharacterized protein LOC118523206 [Halichoerus grypus]